MPCGFLRARAAVIVETSCNHELTVDALIAATTRRKRRAPRIQARADADMDTGISWIKNSGQGRASLPGDVLSAVLMSGARLLAST